LRHRERRFGPKLTKSKNANPRRLIAFHDEVHNEVSELMGAMHRAGGTVTFLGIKRTQGKLVLSCPIYAVSALMSNGNFEKYVLSG